MTSAGAEAPVHIEWEYNGAKSEKDLVFPVRVNSGMGADAVNGKARRKAAAWLIAQVTGMEIPEGDATDVDAPRKAGRFAPIDVTPKEEQPAQADDDTPANFKEAGLSVEQVQELYAFNKWVYIHDKAALLPAKALRVKWDEMQAVKGGAL